MTFGERISKARAHVGALDAIDRANGNQTPADAGPLTLFAVGMEAIEAGLNIGDLDTVAQGYVMLMDFIVRGDVVRGLVRTEGGE